MSGPGKAKGARPNREGRPWKRADGRWAARVWPPRGGISTKPQYVYGKTRADVVAKKKEREAELARGLGGNPDMLLGDYFARWVDETLPQYVRSGAMQQSTLDSYRDNVALHIVPAKGPTLRHVRIGELTAKTVRDWMDALAAKPSGRPRVKLRRGEAELPPGKVLGIRTVAYCRSILRKAIEDAIRDEIGGIDRNVVDLVPPPKRRQKAQARTITPEEAAKLLTAMADDRFWCYWLVAFVLGFRRGEGLGMRWADLDFGKRVWTPALSVQRLRGETNPETGRREGRLVAKDLKTEASSQPVALPASAATALEKWRTDQKKIRLAAPRWADLDLVFTTGLGTAIEPRNIDRQWEKVRARAGVPGWIRLHDLRHACASYLLHAGVNIKLVQRTLRHARLSTTEMYTHAIEEVPREAADMMDKLFDALRSPEGRKETGS